MALLGTAPLLLFFLLFILPVKRATVFSPSLSRSLPFCFILGKILICQSHTTVVGIPSMTGDYITGCVMAVAKLFKKLFSFTDITLLGN
jgi:hypothetical protein